MADNPYLIRRMGYGEWRELRAISLEAVGDTPTAFSSSYAYRPNPGERCCIMEYGDFKRPGRGGTTSAYGGGR